MPNWAFGTLSVTGTKQNVLNFAQRFIYEQENGVYPDVPFFAKSIAHTKRDAATEEINAAFKEIPAGENNTFSLFVGFAWSAHDCIVNIDPQKYPECITLKDACVKDCVSVEIKASEDTAGFEESIYCDKDGRLESTFVDMDTIACEHCGTDNLVPSFSKASECECHECGEKIVYDAEVCCS